MPVGLKSIVSKLNDTTRTALEGAAGLCLARTHYDVEIEHFLMKLLDASDSDFARILKQFGVDKARLAAELTRSLDKLKTGNARTPSFSPSLFKMLTRGVDARLAGVRRGPGALRLHAAGAGFRRRPGAHRARDRQGAAEDRAGIAEASSCRPSWRIRGSMPRRAAPRRAPAPRRARGVPKPGGKTPNLDQFTVNLTENAKKGKIDPVLGRDFEIRQIVDILTRRRQNNPILTGEAGVGKTAVVEGFASRIVQGDVPPVLRNVTVRTLDLALLQAGRRHQGRIREPAEGVDRRSEVFAHSHHPVHRRSAHHDRRRRRRRGRTTPPTC